MWQTFLDVFVKEEREVGWVEKWGEVGRGENMTKTHEKILERTLSGLAHKCISGVKYRISPREA